MFTAAEGKRESFLKPAHSRGAVLRAMAGKDAEAEEARISTPPSLSIRRRLIVRWNSLFPTHKFADFHIDETLLKAIIA